MALDRKDTLTNNKPLSVSMPQHPEIKAAAKAQAPDLTELKQTLQKHKIMTVQNGRNVIDHDALAKLDRKTIGALQKELAESGLYGLKVDGRAGPGTRFALDLVADENNASKFLNDAVKDKNLTQDKTKLMMAQSALSRMGYKAEPDGDMGPQTGSALQKYLQDHPAQNDTVNPGVQTTLDKYPVAGKLSTTFIDLAAGGRVFETFKVAPPNLNTNLDDFLPAGRQEGKSLLRGDMLEFLEKNPSRLPYAKLALEAAQKHGIDENRFVNQIFQESKFNPLAKGPQTRFGQALGIAQFLPGTAKEFDVDKHELTDPKKVAKVLDAAAQKIALDTTKYGSQQLAIVAYNGGERTIESAKSEINKKRERDGLEPKEKITIEDWREVMDSRRAALESKMEKQGRDPDNYRSYTRKERSMWHYETRGYDDAINSERFSPDQLRRAMEYSQNKPAAPATQPVPVPSPAPTQEANKLETAQSFSSVPAMAQIGTNGGSLLSRAFDYARSLANNVPVMSSPDLAQQRNATVQGFLKDSFKTANFAPTAGDNVPAPQQKDPVIATPTQQVQAFNYA